MSDIAVRIVKDQMRAFAERDPTIDPHNPWPPGCDWWHKANEIYNRNRRLSRRSIR